MRSSSQNLQKESLSEEPGYPHAVGTAAAAQAAAAGGKQTLAAEIDSAGGVLIGLGHASVCANTPEECQQSTGSLVVGLTQRAIFRGSCEQPPSIKQCISNQVKLLLLPPCTVLQAVIVPQHCSSSMQPAVPGCKHIKVGVVSSPHIARHRNARPQAAVQHLRGKVSRGRGGGAAGRLPL